MLKADPGGSEFGSSSSEKVIGVGKQVDCTHSTNVRVIGDRLAVSWNDVLHPAPQPTQRQLRTVSAWGVKDELETRGVSPTSFARQIDVPPNRISQILSGKRAVTGDSALRFGHWFGMDPQFWLNLQAQYDLAVAEQLVGAEVRVLPTAAGGPG